MIEIVLFIVGLIIGRYGPHWLWLVRVSAKMIDLGICFRYRGRGYMETIDGTMSEFCDRCGHCYGYHWIDLRKKA